MNPIFKRFTTLIIISIITIACYYSFAYQLERPRFIELFSLYTSLFFLAYILIEKLKLNFWVLVGLGMCFRLIFIFAIPNLSQDFYRFIWDGRVVSQGISPYLFTPEMYFSQVSETIGKLIPLADELYKGMGSLSANNYSNYPPINQLFFAVATVLGGKSIMGTVIALRILIIFADLGILYFGKKLLQKLELPIENIFWFFLNPFIIIELSGNLHFEGVMLVFLIWALNVFFKGNWFWAAVLFGISISVKLIPLLLLPIFIKYFSKNKLDKEVLHSWISTFSNLFKFYFVIGITLLLTFLPFLSVEFLQNFSSTIALWFQKFEFNASIYYVIRWIGFKVVGWNIIEIVGKILPLVTLLIIFGISLLRRNKNPHQMIHSMLFAISFYFLLSTTVHPWYVATPLLLSVFTPYKFPLIWSFMVFLSYSAYGSEGFNENLGLVSLEYITVIALAIWEIGRSRQKAFMFQKDNV